MCGSAFQIGGFTNFRRMFENYISILNVHTDYFMEILESTNCIKFVLFCNYNGNKDYFMIKMTSIFKNTFVKNLETHL